MGPKADNQYDRIEESQRALRDSIEHSKQLAQRADSLLEKHRKRPAGAEQTEAS